MSRWYDKDDIGCGTVAGLIVLILLFIFCGPWIVMHAWYLIAVQMFNLPALNYWAAFWGVWAIRILFNGFKVGSSKNE